MAILDPAHLLEQAERLIVASSGPPRQVDIRRAISAAYYAVFHAVLTAAADEYVGSSKRTSSQYGLAYRSVDHISLVRLCEEIQKSTLSARYRPHTPADGFGRDILAFAAAVLELQESRRAADYDPMVRVKRSNATVAVNTARSALESFARANPAGRVAFLGLLLFRPRP